jgi:hypothetical protein
VLIVNKFPGLNEVPFRHDFRIHFKSGSSWRTEIEFSSVA